MNRIALPFVGRLLCTALIATMVAAGPATAQIAASEAPAATAAEPGSPVRLRQAPRPEAEPRDPEPAAAAPAQPYVPGEFELFVQRSSGAPARRLGAELATESRTADAGAVVPPDYVIAPGDEVLLLLWGSVDADLRLVVDRAGRIAVPRVGSIQVGGVRHADLHAAIERRVGQAFKNFQLSASLGQLRGIRVYVTGFVVKPGSYTVGALSTVVGALMSAGGPSAAGSFRHIELKRAGKQVARFDLYDLLLRGDRSADRLIQSGDVVHVGAVGTQVGVVGSVNRPAVVELVAGEGVADALAMAGGFSAVADRTRLALERLQDRTTQRVAELQLPRDAGLKLDHGDLVRAFSATDALLSTQFQNKRVRIDGEVLKPGEYLLPPASTLRDAIRAAGGLAPAAFVYGAQFSRESVRATQQENYDRALRDLETDLARNVGSQRVSSADQATQNEAQATATARLMERLRVLRPSGRVVLQLEPESMDLPELALEDGDRLYIPPRPTTVGVFGSVFNTGSYLHSPERTLNDYLRLAGGPTKGADEDSIFVVRASGQVISGLQRGGAWFASGGDRIGSVGALPGDTIFVPQELDRTTFVQLAKDWTQILYQFGIGLAGIKNAIQ